jgi:translation initiation factor 5A
MTNEGTTKDDVKVPEGDVGEKIQADFDDGKTVFVSITKAMGEEACLSFRSE